MVSSHAHPLSLSASAKGCTVCTLVGKQAVRNADAGNCKMEMALGDVDKVHLNPTSGQWHVEDSQGDSKGSTAAALAVIQKPVTSGVCQGMQPLQKSMPGTVRNAAQT